MQSDTKLEAIRRGPSLVDQAWRRLHAAIMKGALSPGEKLVEAKLAAELNISRTPVREAVRRLEAEGLVAVDSDGQKIVARRSADEIREIYEVRTLLEEYAAREAAGQVTSDELDRMRAVCEIATEAAYQEQVPKVSTLNVEFHELIVAAAKNATLLSLFRVVHSQAAPYRVFAAGNSHELSRLIEGHRHIVAALSSRDAEAAAQAVRDHSMRAMTQFLSADTEPARG